MSAPRWQPEGALGRQLIDAGRAESPPRALTHRVLGRAGASTHEMHPVRASRRAWVAGALGAAAAAAAVVGWGFLQGGFEPTPPAAAPTQGPVVVATPAPEPIPSASATVAAGVQVASTSTEDAGADAATPSATAVAQLTPAAPAKPKAATTGAGAAPTGTAAAGAACGCAPSDLVCNMRCASKE